VAIVTDNRFSLEFITDAALLVSYLRGRVDLLDAWETGLIRYELVDAVNHNRETWSVAVCSGTESGAGLKRRALHFNSLRYIEEARLLSDLAQISAPKCQFYYDV